MPSIYYLNTPPHPFWDFVSGMEDYPFFRQRRPGPPPPSARPGFEEAQTKAQASADAAKANFSEKAKGKQAEVNTEDPPDVDPSTVRPTRKDMPFRGRGRFSKAFEGEDTKEKNEDGEDRHRGKRGCHGDRRSQNNGLWGAHHGGPPFGPPPFMFGPNFPVCPRGRFGRPAGPEHEGPEGHEGHDPHAGFHGRCGPHRGRFGHHRPGPHSHSSPHGGPFARRGGDSGFDLGSFLNNLGERIGLDLTAAAEGLGLKQPRSTESDFEPRTDIFDSASEYIIHMSLPGAKKSDVGVDWDGEHSHLRIAGVVHRPGVDEAMMSRLVVDGRKRETGVFEKIIRLGTSKDPASINVEDITAKMVDGVLVVRVPKAEKTFEKKQVRIDGSSPSPAVSAERPEETYVNEKDLLFDAEEDKEMYDAEEHAHQDHLEPASSEAVKGKQPQAAEEDAGDDRSETVGPEHPNVGPEHLPRYEVEEPEESKLAKEHSQEDNMSDWEKYGSEDEGEYVKINVD